MSMEGDHLKPSIGFIGMGHMGSHMAQRLLDAGYQLTVYDCTKEKAQEVETTWSAGCPDAQRSSCWLPDCDGLRDG